MQKRESTFKGTQVWFRVLSLATLLGSSISSFKSHDCSPWFRFWLGHYWFCDLGKSNNISYLTSFYFLMKRMNDINSFNFKCMLWELSRQYTEVLRTVPGMWQIINISCFYLHDSQSVISKLALLSCTLICLPGAASEGVFPDSHRPLKLIMSKIELTFDIIQRSCHNEWWISTE